MLGAAVRLEDRDACARLQVSGRLSDPGLGNVPLRHKVRAFRPRTTDDNRPLKMAGSGHDQHGVNVATASLRAEYPRQLAWNGRALRPEYRQSCHRN